MRCVFETMVLGALTTLFLAAPGFAGDTEKCQKGADCCKVTGKACDSKAESKSSKRERNRDDRKTKAERRMSKLTTFSINQSGGFAGLNRGYEVNLADLSETERTDLEQLIERSGLLKDSGAHMTKGAADMFVYNFSASYGDKKYSVSFDDGTIPQSYRPLLDFTKGKLENLKR